MWHAPFTSLVTTSLVKSLCQPALRTCGRGLRDPGSGLLLKSPTGAGGSLVVGGSSSPAFLLRCAAWGFPLGTGTLCAKMQLLQAGAGFHPGACPTIYGPGWRVAANHNPGPCYSF
jgi:hypothetical protein